MSMPSVRIYGNRLVQILAHRGLCGCTESEIDINSGAGVICIKGKDLAIAEINDEYISVKGDVNSITYGN